MSETITKEPLLRRLTAKGGSIRRKDSKSGPNSAYTNAPKTIQVTNLFPQEPPIPHEDNVTSSKQMMVDIGGQQIPLSTVSIGVAVLVILGIIWRAIMAFSASLIRLFITLIVIGGVLLLSSGPEKQSKEALRLPSLNSHHTEAG